MRDPSDLIPVMGHLDIRLTVDMEVIENDPVWSMSLDKAQGDLDKALVYYLGYYASQQDLFVFPFTTGPAQTVDYAFITR